MHTHAHALSLSPLEISTRFYIPFSLNKTTLTKNVPFSFSIGIPFEFNSSNFICDLNCSDFCFPQIGFVCLRHRLLHISSANLKFSLFYEKKRVFFWKKIDRAKTEPKLILGSKLITPKLGLAWFPKFTCLKDSWDRMKPRLKIRIEVSKTKAQAGPARPLKLKARAKKIQARHISTKILRT